MGQEALLAERLSFRGVSPSRFSLDGVKGVKRPLPGNLVLNRKVGTRATGKTEERPLLPGNYSRLAS